MTVSKPTPNKPQSSVPDVVGVTAIANLLLLGVVMVASWLTLERIEREALRARLGQGLQHAALPGIAHAVEDHRPEGDLLGFEAGVERALFRWGELLGLKHGARRRE